MISDEDKLLIRRVQEAVRSAGDKHRSKFIGFLDEHRLSLAINTVEAEGYRNYLLWGGYSSANRCIFGVFAPYEQPDRQQFPLCALRLSYRRAAALTHRDFLGSLMNLGIKRESVGDILVGEGSTIVFLHEDICRYVTEQLTKVGGEGVKAEVISVDDIDYTPQFEELRDSIASPRIDCVVASLAHLSRSAAADMIGQGLVSLGHVQCTRVADEVMAADVISIRGKGKFIIDSIDTHTRKGRIIMMARKYI